MDFESFAVWKNPIALAHGRTQLRWEGTLAWSIVTISVVAFIFLITYLTMTERGQVDPVEAAKAAMVPLIVVQCVLLMGMGTAAVARGIAKDREAGTLDYHRMTPMPAFQKIVGYLFGLPARSYFLFGLTLPFLAYAVWRGGISPLKVTHFYVVFFSSVWMYHLFGLMAGMMARNPKLSTAASSTLVMLLYFIMPVLARLGLSFLDFLTVRPTFYGMVSEEVQRGEWSHRVEGMMDRYAGVQFFGFELNPTLFTLIVQGLAIAALLHVVRRKWIDASWHPFSKRFGMVFFAAVCVLLVGSLWPHLQGRAIYDRMNLQTFLHTDGGALMSLAMVFGGVSMVTALLTVSWVTPSQVTAKQGLRRARKAGLTRVPKAWDAASSLPLTGVLLLAGVLSATAMAWAWNQGDRAALKTDLWSWATMLLVLMTAVLLTYQGLHERLGRGMVILLLFIAWIVPCMVAMVVLSAFDHANVAMYAMVPCAPAMGAVGLMEMTATYGDGAMQRFLENDLPSARFSLWASMMLYVGLALLAQISRLRGARQAWVEEGEVKGQFGSG